MMQDYSKSFHDFNDWTYLFSLFIFNPHLPLPPQVPEPPWSSPIALWNFDLKACSFLSIVTGDRIVSLDRMR